MKDLHSITLKAISHIHRNRTEKLKCLNTYERFHIYTETERRTENLHELDFNFFGFGGRISANTTDIKLHLHSHVGCLLLSNYDIIDGLSSETIVRLFYKHDTTEYSLLWDKTQSNYKDHKLKAVAWNNLYCKGISVI